MAHTFAVDVIIGIMRIWKWVEPKSEADRGVIDVPIHNALKSVAYR